VKRRSGLIVLSLCLVGINAQAADDAQVGHWMLDLAKSQYVTGIAPRSSEVTITPYGKDGVSVTVNTLNPKGERVVFQCSAEYDGKPYPRTETGPGAIAGQSVTLKRLGTGAIERIVYLGGKPVGTERWVISRDGKTRTVTQSGVDAQGKAINNVLVYAKQ
jgi:hypothetical protein